MAFVYHNEDAENAKTIKLIKAKYDSEGVLVSTAVEDVEVAAATSVLKKVTAPTDGGTWKYFAWEGFDLMKPITNVKEF